MENQSGNHVKHDLIRALMRFKKVALIFPAGVNLHMGELFVLGVVADGECDPEKQNYMSDLHTRLHVSKPAISQILNSLEKKGYLCRAIDKTDRRRIQVKLTDMGQDVTKQMREHIERTFNAIIERVGEEDVETMIRLMNRFAEVSEAVRDEMQQESKGDME